MEERGRGAPGREHAGQRCRGAAERGVCTSVHSGCRQVSRTGWLVTETHPVPSWVLEVRNQGVARAISRAREPLGEDGLGAWLSDSGAASDPWCHTPTGLHPHVAFSARVCLHRAFRRVTVSVPPFFS